MGTNMGLGQINRWCTLSWAVKRNGKCFNIETDSVNNFQFWCIIALWLTEESRNLSGLWPENMKSGIKLIQKKKTDFMLFEPSEKCKPQTINVMITAKSIHNCLIYGFRNVCPYQFSLLARTSWPFLSMILIEVLVWSAHWKIFWSWSGFYSVQSPCSVVENKSPTKLQELMNCVFE